MEQGGTRMDAQSGATERRTGTAVVNEQEARSGISDSRRAELEAQERAAGESQDAGGSGSRTPVAQDGDDEPVRPGSAPQIEQPEKSANSPVTTW